jgi:Chaperone of endosialidase
MSQRNSDKTILKKSATASARPSVGNVSVFAQNSLDVSNLVLNNQAISIQPESLSYLNVTTAGVAQANKAVVLNNSSNIENLGDISTGELYVDGDLVTGVVNRGATVSDSIYMNNIQPGVSSPEKILSASPTGEITANVQSDIVKYNGGELKGKKTLDMRVSEETHRDFVDFVNFYVIQSAFDATFDIGPRTNRFVYENVGNIMICNSKLTATSHTLQIFQNPYASNGGSFNISISPTTETHSYQCAYDATFTRYMIPYITGTTTATLNIYVSPNTDPSTWTSVAWTVVSLPNTTTGGSDILTPSIKWSSLLNQYVIFYANTLYGSTNGTTWTSISTTPATMGFTGKLIVHPNYLLVINTTTTTYFTTNGTSWTSKVFASAPMTASTDFPVFLPELDVIRFNTSNSVTASTFLSLASTGVAFATNSHPTLYSNINPINLTYLSTPNCYVWNSSGNYRIYNISKKILYSGLGSYYSGYINFGSFNTTTFADARCWRYAINLNKTTIPTSYVDINPETFLNFENKNRAVIRDFEWAPAINKYVAIGFVDDAYNTTYQTNVFIYHSDDLETFTFVADTGSATVNKLCLNPTNGYIYMYGIGTTACFYAPNYGINGVTSNGTGTVVTGIYYIPSLYAVVSQQTAYLNIVIGDPTSPLGGSTNMQLSYAGVGASGNCIFNPNSLDVIFNPGTLLVSTTLTTLIIGMSRLQFNSSGGTAPFSGSNAIRNGYPGNISMTTTTTTATDSNNTNSFKRISSNVYQSIIKTNVSGSVISGLQYSNIEYIEPLGIFVAVYTGSNHLDTNRIVYSYDCRTWVEPASNSISANLINIKSSTVKYDSNSGYMYVLGSNGFFKTIHSTKKLNLEESMLSKTQLSHFYVRDNSGLELFPFSTIKSSDNTNVSNNGIAYSKGVYVTCCTNKISVGSKIINMVDTTLTGNWTSIASSLTHFIAAGNGQIAISNNLGSSFSLVTNNISSYDWNFISYSDQVGRWAMCAGDAFAFSTDGTTWTTTVVSGGNWKSIKYSNGFWLAVGLNKIAYVNNTNATTNGAVTVVNISGDWRDSAFGGQWIITGYGKTALSTNINSLTNWTTITAANNKNYNSVVYVEGIRQFYLVGEHTAVYVQMTKIFYQPSNQILINTGESAWGVMNECIWSDRYQAVICVGAGRSIIGSRILGSGLDNSYFNVNSQFISGYDNTVANSYLSISDNPLTPSTADGQILIRSNVLAKPFISFKNNGDGLLASIDNKSTTAWGLTVPKCLSLEYTKFFRLNNTTLAYTPAELSYLSIDQLGTSTPNTYITTDISGDVAAAGALNVGGLVLGNKIYSNTTPIIMQSVTNGVVSASKACKLDSSKNLANVNVLSTNYLNIGVDTFDCIPVDTSFSMFAHTQTSTDCSDNTALDACYHSDLDIYVAASNMTEFTNATNVERNYLLFSKDGIIWNKCFTGLYANFNRIIPLYADATKNHFFINTTTVTTYIGFVLFATSNANNIGKIYFTPDLVNFYPLNITGAATTHDTNYGTNSTIFMSDGSPDASVICNRSASSTNKFIRNINSSSGVAITFASITETNFKYILFETAFGDLHGLAGNTTVRFSNTVYTTIATLSTVTANALVYARALNGVSANWDFIIACNSGKILHGGPSIGLQIGGGTELVIDATVNFTCCEYNFTSKRFLLGSNTGKIYISAAGSKTSWSQVTTPAWMNGSWVGIRSIGSKGFMIWHDDNGDNSKRNSKICRVDENNTFQLMYQSFEKTLGIGCYGAGKYIIPEPSGVLTNKIMYSDDGMNWKYTLSSSNSFNRTLYMTHLNLFVAIASGTVFSSSDGITWNLVYTHPGGGALNSSSLYAAGRNLLVITYRNTTSNNVVTSSDLSQWNTYNYTSYNNIWYSAYSPSLDRFIFSPASGSLPAFYTTNFTTWNPCVSLDTDTLTIPFGRNLHWFQSSNEFYLGQTALLWQSYDGISWKKVAGYINYDNSNINNMTHLAGLERNFIYIPNVGDVTVNGTDPDGSFLVNVSNGMYKPIAILGGGIKGDDYATLIYNSDDNKVLVYKTTTSTSRKGEYFQLVDLEEHKQKNNKEIAIDYVDKIYGDRLSLDNYVGTSNIRTLVNSTLDGGSANKNAIINTFGTWVGRTSADSNGGWCSIAWSPSLGIFAAVAFGGGTVRVMTSEDGVTWTARNSSNNANAWNSICWSPDLGLFVAVAGSGTGRVMVSTDGISWTGKTPSSDSNVWQSVCWSPYLSLFVAVASTGTNRVMTSPDGNTWTGVVSSNETTNWYSICWSPELRIFISVANAGTQRAMTSSNGTTWSNVTSGVPTASWVSVCWSPELGMFAAVSSSASGSQAVMTSNSGISWTGRSSSLDTNQWFSICWSSDFRMFVATSVSGTGKTMMSKNGIIWSSLSINSDVGNWYGICYSPQLRMFAAVSSNSEPKTATLSDSKTILNSNLHITNYNQWSGSCYSPELNLFVLLSYGDNNSKKVAISSDGVIWRGVQAVGSYWRSVCWSPTLSLFVAVTNVGYNRVMTSTNGTTWTLRDTAGNSSNWQSVCWSAELGLFVAVADNGTTSTGTSIMTSDNGTTWTLRTSPIAANYWNSVCWAPSLTLFVAVSYFGSNRVMTSADGISWSSGTTASESSPWMSVCWSPTLSLFVAVAEASTNNIMTSSNGTGWTLRVGDPTTSMTMLNVIWAGGHNMFIAVGYAGSSRVLVSNDGITWYYNSVNKTSSLRSITHSASLKKTILGSSTVGSFIFSVDNINNYGYDIINTVGSAGDLLSITWAPSLSLFVATTLSTSQRFITSPDAKIWTIRSSTVTTPQCYSVAWASSIPLFVAVSVAGTQRVVTSPDGITWTLQNASNNANQWMGVAWSPSLSLFVAVAQSGTNRIMYSSNGTSWTAGPSTFDSNAWVSIEWSPSLGLFVAVANSGTNRVIYSSDGTNWTATTSSGESNAWNSICWSPELGIFAAVAISGTNRVMTSTNGTSWTARTPSDDTVQWQSICWSSESNMFMAVSSSGTNRVMVSNDGITWYGRAASNESTVTKRAVCWSPALKIFTSVGMGSGNKIEVHPNVTVGATSQPFNRQIINYNGTTIFHSITWSPELNLFAAVGFNGGTHRVAISPDGISWTHIQSTNDAASWFSICWSPALNLFAATSLESTNNVMISSNGVNWTAINSGNSGSGGWLSICWSPALSLFVAVSNNGTNRVMTSSNGTVWTRYASSGETNVWRSICWSQELGLFVAVASSGTNLVMTSSNGTSWTGSVSVNESSNWMSVCWSAELGLFMAVAIGSNIAMYSSNGTSWTSITLPVAATSLTDVIWASGMGCFIALNETGTDNNIFTSTNGITWNARTHYFNRYFNSIGYSPTLNVAAVYSANVNDAFNIITSLPPILVTLPYTVAWDIFWSKSLQRFIAYKKVDPTTNDTQIYLSKDGYSWTYDATSYTAINAASRLKAVTSSCEVPFLDAIYTCRNTAFVHSLTPIGVVQSTVTGVPTANALYYSNILKCLIIGSASSNLIALCIPTKTGNINNIITYTLPATITVSQILTCAGNHLIIPSGSTSSYYYSTNMNVFSTGTLPVAGVWKFDARNVRGYSKRVVGVNTAGVIIYSDDGISWATAATYTVSTRSFVNVKYIQEFDAFVAVDSISKTNAAVYSFDGITWSDITFSSSVSLCDAAYSSSNDNFVFLSTGSDLVTTIVTLPKSAAGGNIIPYETRNLSGLTSNIFNLNSKGGIYTGDFTSNTFISAETENVPLLALHTNSAYKPTNSSWTIQSDVRIKHDIENADLDQCFDNVKSLDLKHYNWKEEFLAQTGETDRSRLGWIAQDVEQILPKSIVEMGSMYGLENLKTLNQDQIVATMYGAVQKLMQKYEALQNELDGLE